MVCKACEARGKTWAGSDPKCAFTGGVFGDNWNCATIDTIRDAMSRFGDRHRRVDYRAHDDQNYATVDIADLELPSGEALSLWVSWYKGRGRTDAMWLLSESRQPRLPTEDDCVAIGAALAK